MGILNENLHVSEILSCAKLHKVVGAQGPYLCGQETGLFQDIVEVEKGLESDTSFFYVTSVTISDLCVTLHQIAEITG